jgi:uncharacterized protein YbjT (DUF2867 family)
MKIVVIGGSGLIGRKVVDKLRGRGHEVVAASPRSGVNTLTGEGLAPALTNAQAVIDVTDSPSYEDTAVMEFFTTSTRHLLAAEATAGVAHHVALSIVGIERAPGRSGYYRAKVAQEKLIQDGSIPYSIVRATQFFEFIKSIAEASTDGGTIRLAPALIQPIAADDVAAVVCEIALGPPLNSTVEVAGPEQFRLDELIQRALSAWNDPHKVISDSHAPYFGGELDARTLLPQDGHVHRGETRLEEWLRRHPASA